MLMTVDINVMGCDLAAKTLKTILSSLLKSRVEHWEEQKTRFCFSGNDWYQEIGRLYFVVRYNCLKFKTHFRKRVFSRFSCYIIFGAWLFAKIMFQHIPHVSNITFIEMQWPARGRSVGFLRLRYLIVHQIQMKFDFIS